MLGENRIRKHQSKLHLKNTTPNQKTTHKRKGLPHCKYQCIPPPLKYTYHKDVFLLYGNIPIYKDKHDCYTDFSLLNEFHIYLDVKMKHFKGQRLITIPVERRPDAKFCRWKTIVKNMKNTKDRNLKTWAKTIKSYCIWSENKIDAYWKKIDDVKEMKLEEQYTESSLAKEISQNNQRKDELLKTYPCIQLRTSLKGYESRLYEIILNEEFIKSFGFTVESFASNVLREGLPQFIILPLQRNSNLLFNLLQNYTGLDTQELSSPKIEAKLLTKSGYVKDAKLQVQFLMNYDNPETYGIDTVFTIAEQGEPYVQEKEREMNIKRDFVDFMLNREKEITDFLFYYYNYITYPKYSNIDRICHVKELEES